MLRVLFTRLFNPLNDGLTPEMLSQRQNSSDLSSSKKKKENESIVEKCKESD